MSRVEDLFNDAMDLPTEERRAFLDRACGQDSDLRAAVESLIAADDPAARYLEGPALSLVADMIPPALRPVGLESLIGRRIGDYQILGLIGQGGMGVVFEAEQSRPSRRVALKLIRTGLTSPTAVNRFDDEAQILARLSHPGIAQVYAAGTHQEGSDLIPYFAMEFIPGARSLTRYATVNQLSTEDRLNMFAAVCDAVHYGHQRGVIHRDLKPGNILVDGAGRPKVIDFGIARLSDADPRSSTRRTDLRQLVGTLPYMSPEQFAPDARNVDTRSDLYSLGVVLYELMCGRLPYDVHNVAIAAAARIIQEEAPPRISSIDPSLRGDVEAIVHKAIEKDPAARYESIAGLARDIRRSLDDLPIEARPPSAMDHLYRLVRRHKFASALAMALFLSICTFGAAMSLLYARSETHRKAASQARQTADEQAAVAQRVSASLESIIRGLAPTSSPVSSASLAVETVPQSLAPVDVLDRCAAEIEQKLRDQPLARARLQDALGNAYLTLDQRTRARRFIEAAHRHRRKALPNPHPDLASSTFSMAVLEEASGNDDAAKTYYRESLDMRLALLGNDHLDVQNSRLRLFHLLARQRSLEEAKSVIKAYAAAMASSDTTDPATLAGAYHIVGTFLMGKGDFDEAEANIRESIALRRKVPGKEMSDQIKIANVVLASLDYKRGRYAEALEKFSDAYQALELIFGGDSPQCVHLLNNIALVRGLTGDVTGAMTLFDEVLRRKRKLHGERGHQVGHSLYDLSTVRLMSGDLAAAESAARKAFDIMRKSDYPARDVFLGAILIRLGDVALARGDVVQAGEFAREALGQMDKCLPPDHWQFAEARNLHARCLSAQGRTQEARPMLAESYAVLVRVFKERIPPTILAKPEPDLPNTGESDLHQGERNP